MNYLARQGVGRPTVSTAASKAPARGSYANFLQDLIVQKNDIRSYFFEACASAAVKIIFVQDSGAADESEYWVMFTEFGPIFVRHYVTAGNPDFTTLEFWGGSGNKVTSFRSRFAGAEEVQVPYDAKAASHLQTLIYYCEAMYQGTTVLEYPSIYLPFPNPYSSLLGTHIDEFYKWVVGKGVVEKAMRGNVQLSPIAIEADDRWFIPSGFDVTPDPNSQRYGLIKIVKTERPVWVKPVSDALAVFGSAGRLALGLGAMYSASKYQSARNSWNLESAEIVGADGVSRPASAYGGPVPPYNQTYDMYGGYARAQAEGYEAGERIWEQNFEPGFVKVIGEDGLPVAYYTDRDWDIPHDSAQDWYYGSPLGSNSPTYPSPIDVLPLAPVDRYDMNAPNFRRDVWNGPPSVAGTPIFNRFPADLDDLDSPDFAENYYANRYFRNGSKAVRSKSVIRGKKTTSNRKFWAAAMALGGGVGLGQTVLGLVPDIKYELYLPQVNSEKQPSYADYHRLITGFTQQLQINANPNESVRPNIATKRKGRSQPTWQELNQNWAPNVMVREAQADYKQIKAGFLPEDQYNAFIANVRWYCEFTGNVREA